MTSARESGRDQESPRVTVLMTMFNAAAHLRPAVESVLAQTFGDFEFLIIDDGSRDDSVAIVDSYADARIRLVRNPENKGQTACLNEGLALARGEWIARQDADDISRPARLDRQMARLRADDRLALLGSRGWIVDEQDKFAGLLDVPLGPESIEWASLFENPFIHTAAIFRREIAQSLGGYDPSFRICQDYDLWMRIAAQHRTANLAERVVVYRYSPQSLQHSGRETVCEEVTRVLRTVWSRAFARPISDVEISALIGFRDGVPAIELPAFRATYTAMLAEYQSAHPELLGKDFRRTLARQHAQLGRSLLAKNLLLGLAELGRALAQHPRFLLALLADHCVGRFAVPL